MTSTNTNRVRAAAKLDLAKLIAAATVAEITVNAYTDRAAVAEWDEHRDDTDARSRALASRIEIRARRATPATRSDAISKYADDRENTVGFPSEQVYNQRFEHIVGASILSITDADGATADGPLDQPTMASLRAVIGDHAWLKLRNFVTGDSDDAALDADFSQAPSGATPS